MSSSGFFSIRLSGSQSNVTVSKTSVVFIEESNVSPQVTHIHCVGGVSHSVDHSFDELYKELNNFVILNRKDNNNTRVGIHDWNVSYIEEVSKGEAIIYFTERGVSINVTEDYSEVIKKF
ncbi:hypothetical protein [Citrobacter werkmanii]|uniref:hypothetical protein n=1 Tax=Citrobacter werkmanii TaxID=67827 RepID=UPI00126B2EB4|nr:hypothetical protein [Salmonella enterica]EBN2521039.1 hypothetical protein [Salmonella enterica]